MRRGLLRKSSNREVISCTFLSNSEYNRGLTGKLTYSDYDDVPRYLDLATGDTAIINGNGMDPYLSDDGTEAVYEIDTNGRDINGIDAIIFHGLDGSINSRIELNDDDVKARPKLSPDKQKVAIAWQPESIDDGDVAYVTILDRAGRYLNQHVFSGYNKWDWLSDGRLVLGDKFNLYVTDDTLSNKSFLVSLNYVYSDLEISPDDKKAVFTMLGHIWMINLDGTGLKQLTISQKYEESPTWSPDGRYVALRYNKRNVYVVPTDGERVYVGEEHMIPSTAFRLRERFRGNDNSAVIVDSRIYWQ